MIIIDSGKTQLVEYTYDVWGKLLTKTGTLAATLGTLNPFRWRGYVYDEETNLYYLRSRYYSPPWHRFINADSTLGKPGSLLGHNVFVYCKNNPVNRIDPNGCSPVRPLGMPTSGWLKYRSRYYGLSKELAEAIDIILTDPNAYGYRKKGIYRNEENAAVIDTCCQTLYDFGQGYELAVFQSTSETDFNTISAAKFMHDSNKGSNITALRNLGNWDSYSDVTFDSGAFFFNPKSRWYLFGD